MKCKKLLCLAASLTLILGSIAGCGKKNGDSPQGGDAPQADQAGSAMGRYVETDVPLPGQGEEPLGILWEEGGLSLYTATDASHTTFLRYQYNGQEWSTGTEIPWLADAAERLHLCAYYIYGGMDGRLYAMAYPAEGDDTLFYGQYILSSEDGATAVDITPASITEKGDSRDYILDMTVLNDGSLGIACSSRPGIQFYRDKKQIFETNGISFSSDHQACLAASEETIAVFSEDGKSVDFYSAKDFQNLGNVSVDLDLMEALIAPGNDGVWYLMHSQGLLRIPEDGSIVETIMEGSQGLMGSSTAGKMNFVAGGQDDFYCLYREYNQNTCHLKYYSYNDSVPAVSSDSLSIYGLRENPVVSQAVYEFQNTHPEVRIEYNFAVGEWEHPSSDDIRTLNAELLNGSGADVLILDDLPVKAYMEKGILSDISDLKEPLSEKGVLLDVIGNTAQLDGKTYAYPATINVPIRFGSEEGINALESPDALHSYLERHPDSPLFGRSFHGFSGSTLFHVMYDEILAADGAPDEEKLSRLLEDWMQICKNAQTPEFEEALGTEDIPKWGSLGVAFNTGAFYSSDADVFLEEFSGLGSTMIAYTQMDKNGQTPRDLKGYYIPHTIAGVNASSAQQELAREFIETLFSENVQQPNGYNGFPVTEQALEAMADYVETDAAQNITVGSGYEDPLTGEECHLDGFYPSRERVEALITTIKGLRTPFLVESDITNTFLEEAERFYNGEQTAQEAAAAICQKVRMYLAE